MVSLSDKILILIRFKPAVLSSPLLPELRHPIPRYASFMAMNTKSSIGRARVRDRNTRQSASTQVTWPVPLSLPEWFKSTTVPSFVTWK